VALLKAAREAFAKAGISIALPQRDIHVIGMQAVETPDTAVNTPTAKAEKGQGNR
jgi:hypothetical protein